MDVLGGFGWPLVCQSAGELFARAPELRLPGPVLGMLLLLLLLLVLLLCLCLCLFLLPGPFGNVPAGFIETKKSPLIAAGDVFNRPKMTHIRVAMCLLTRHSLWRSVLERSQQKPTLYVSFC